MQGTVKYISPDPKQNEYDYNGVTYKKYKVDFADGKSYSFSQKKNWNNGKLEFEVGDRIEYMITNEKLGSAKSMSIVQGADTKRSQQQEIQLSVSFNCAVKLASKGKIKIDEIETFTKEFYNKIFN